MLIVKVNRDDIRKGRPGLNDGCALALALKRATGKKWHVASSHAENSDGGRIVLPQAARDFVEEFDRSGEGFPFKFEIKD